MLSCMSPIDQGGSCISDMVMKNIDTMMMNSVRSNFIEFKKVSVAGAEMPKAPCKTLLKVHGYV